VFARILGCVCTSTAQKPVVLELNDQDNIARDPARYEIVHSLFLDPTAGSWKLPLRQSFCAYACFWRNASRVLQCRAPTVQLKVVVRNTDAYFSIGTS
jgi:hypothetical protein